MKKQTYSITLINRETLRSHTLVVELDRLQFKALCLWLRGHSSLNLDEILPEAPETHVFFQTSRFSL